MKFSIQVYHQLQRHFSLASVSSLGENLYTGMTFVWVPICHRDGLHLGANSPPKWPSFWSKFATEMVFIWMPIRHQNVLPFGANFLPKWSSFGCQFAAEMAFLLVQISYRNGLHLGANSPPKWPSFWCKFPTENGLHLGANSPPKWPFFWCNFLPKRPLFGCKLWASLSRLNQSPNVLPLSLELAGIVAESFFIWCWKLHCIKFD